MEAIENITLRNSISKLLEPHPSPKEMEIVYQAALRAPDHKSLRPSHFIEITGKGLDKLSEKFVQYAKKQFDNITDEKIEKYRKAPYRAPMIIVLISDLKQHPKVPEIEQMLSTAAAAQNILLALNALNYSAIWRTGIFALNDEIGKYLGLKSNQKILGYIYVGKPKIKAKKIPKIDINNHVIKWH